MDIRPVHSYTHADWQRQHGDRATGQTGTCFNTAEVLALASDALTAIGPSPLQRREMAACQELAEELAAEGLTLRGRYDAAYADVNATVQAAGADGVAQAAEYHQL